jgi:uncharacterized protein (UPF0335 family)
MSGVGHNSGVVQSDELRNLVERVERVTEEITALQDDRKDIFAEAKSRGYDVKTMRAIIQIRKMEPAVYQEQRSLLDTYLAAFGVDV